MGTEFVFFRRRIRTKIWWSYFWERQSEHFFMMMRLGLSIASSLLLALTRAESKSQDYCGHFGAKCHFPCFPASWIKSRRRPISSQCWRLRRMCEFIRSIFVNYVHYVLQSFIVGIYVAPPLFQLVMGLIEKSDLAPFPVCSISLVLWCWTLIFFVSFIKILICYMARHWFGNQATCFANVRVQYVRIEMTNDLSQYRGAYWMN